MVDSVADEDRTIPKLGELEGCERLKVPLVAHCTIYHKQGLDSLGDIMICGEQLWEREGRDNRISELYASIVVRDVNGAHTKVCREIAGQRREERERMGHRGFEEGVERVRRNKGGGTFLDVVVREIEGVAWSNSPQPSPPSTTSMHAHYNDIIATICMKCTALNLKLNYTLYVTSLSSLPKPISSTFAALPSSPPTSPSPTPPPSPPSSSKSSSTDHCTLQQVMPRDVPRGLLQGC